MSYASTYDGSKLKSDKAIQTNEGAQSNRIYDGRGAKARYFLHSSKPLTTISNFTLVVNRFGKIFINTFQ